MAMGTSARRPKGLIDFAVVGAQRAGTTHLNVCLADHPQICLRREEVPYFEDPFYQNRSEAEIDRLFRRARAGQLRGIHRPDYLAKPECALRIRLDAPEARILIVLRDPVRRAVSAYFWYVQFGLLPLLPLDVGMRRLLDGSLEPEYRRAGEVLEFGRYGDHVGTYLDVFGSDRVLVLRTEELRTPEFPRQAYTFLGVRPDHVPLQLRHTTNAGAYDLRRLRFLRARRHFVFGWDSATTYTYRHRRLRRPAGWLIGAGFLAVDRFVLARMLNDQAPRIANSLEAELREYYADDIRLLEKRLNRSFPDWGGKAAR